MTKTSLILSARLMLLISLCMSYFHTAYGGDLPCVATSLPNDMIEFQSYDLSGLSDSGISAPECGNYTGPDIWFEVVCPPSGRLTIVTLAGITTDAAMALYEGTCNNLTEILCVEDDLCDNTIMPIQDVFDLIPGETYFIRLWAHNGSPDGTFDIRVSDGPPPITLFETVNNANYIDVDGEQCIQLTTEGQGQAGCAWDPDQYDFTMPIDVSLEFNFGDLDGNGADGICIVFQNDPAGLNACGATGENIGAGGITNSFIIDFDTWQNGNLGDPPQDHIGIQINGIMGSNIDGPATLPNIEDGQYHTMRFTWDPTTLFYEVYFDGNLELSGNYDIVANCFGGNPMAYYGFTASTGGAVNNHIVCPHPMYPSGNERDEVVEICEGESYYAGGANQTSSGMYTDIFVAYNGCDSIVHTELTVHPVPQIQIDTVICGGECITIAGEVFCEEGNYEVVLIGQSQDGCDSIVSLQLEVLDPFAAVIPPGPLNCSVTEVLLDGSPSTMGDNVSYTWSGPNGFTSNDHSPTTSEPGTYVLTVIQTEDGVICIHNSFPIEVEQNIEMPTADAGPDLDILCGIDSLQIGGPGSSQGPEITYSWTGPGGFNSNEPNPHVTQAGEYILVVTHDISECFSVDITEVGIDIDTPAVEAIGGVFDCSIDSLQINAIADSVESYTWSGPNGYTATIQQPFVPSPGTYILEITDQNGCIGRDTAIVESDDEAPEVSLSADTLNCLLTDIQIIAETSDSNLTFNWSGPNGFTSQEQNPNVSEGGMYELSTIGENGCEDVTTIVVESDLELIPITALGDTIECDEDQVQIFVESSEPFTEISWVGPNGFTSTDQNPFVNSNGLYVVELTGENGCMAIDTAIVFSDDDAPELTMITDSITCFPELFSVGVNVNQGNVMFEWTGPSNFLSGLQYPEVLEAGLYQVVVTSANGCSSVGEVEVIDDTDLPEFSLLEDTLDCNQAMLILSTDADNSYTHLWEGPNGFSSDETAPEIQEGGLYSLTVTGKNGCSDIQSVEISTDFDLPQYEILIDTINCLSQNFYVSLQNSDSGITFQWSGPGGYSSLDQTAEVFIGGMYSISVEGMNGCESVYDFEILEDLSSPELMINDVNLNCLQPNASVIPEGDLAGLSFLWMGPNGFIENTEQVVISNEGKYYVQSTGTNGCESLDSFMVTEDFDLPGVSLNVAGPIDCQNNGVTILADLAGQISLIEWAGPDGYSSTNEDPFVDVEGIYHLTVTGNNGCVSQDSINILSIAEFPSLTLNADTITCILETASITSTTNANQPDYLWNGPQGFMSTMQEVIVNSAGIYTLEVTNAENNCKAIETIEVIEDTESPVFSLEADSITCNNPQADLLCEIGSSGYSFAWSGPGGFGSSLQNTITNQAGIYSLLVTDLSNGCTDEAVVDVPFIEGPESILLESFDPFCGEDYGSLIIEEVIGGSPPYMFQLDGGSFQEELDFNSIDPGVHILNVVDFYNCTLSEIIEIQEINNPEITLDVELVLPFGGSQQLFPQLNVDVNQISEVTWSPSIGLDCTNCLNPVASPSQSTTYTVTIVDQNGCTAEASITLRVEDLRLYVPNVFSPNNDGINDQFTIFGNPDQIVHIESLHIFDRWGNNLFTGLQLPINDEAKGWDGSYRKQPVNPAVYAYLAKILLINGEEILLSGSFTLIR